MIRHSLLPLFSAAALIAVSGCVAYRVDSNVESPAPTATPTPTAVPIQVLLSEDNLPGRRYKELGPIEISVKKLTAFHKDPTKEQANEALIEKARVLGADAIINITYKSGIGFTTWGYIDASGTAVKFLP